MLSTVRHLLDVRRPWSHLDAPPAPAENYTVRAADGLNLQLRRVPPGDGSTRRTRPVMLLHGLAANHRGFHLRGRSMARWLAARGHDVWLPELRGHGDSQRPGLNWRLDDYLRDDLPAIIDAILGHTEAERLHWVGHSMGGVLLFAYGILHPDAPIARGITLGSALDYSIGESEFERLLAVRPLIERLEAIPYGALMHLLAPVLGRGRRTLERFNVWPSNIEPEVVRTLHARCFHTIPVSLLTSLATTFEPEGLRLQSGFRFAEHAGQFSPPVRLVAGSRDVQVSREAIEHTSELLGPNAEMLVHGPPSGDADHYGHWDLVVGRRAPEETWPRIAEWLEV